LGRIVCPPALGPTVPEKAAAVTDAAQENTAADDSMRGSQRVQDNDSV
jgi:hypothetical protein